MLSMGPKECDIVVFLTAFSIRVSPLSSKIHNGDDTPKGRKENQNIHFKLNKFVPKIVPFTG